MPATNSATGSHGEVHQTQSLEDLPKSVSLCCMCIMLYPSHSYSGSLTLYMLYLHTHTALLLLCTCCTFTHTLLLLLCTCCTFTLSHCFSYSVHAVPSFSFKHTIISLWGQQQCTLCIFWGGLKCYGLLLLLLLLLPKMKICSLILIIQ